MGGKSFQLSVFPQRHQGRKLKEDKEFDSTMVALVIKNQPANAEDIRDAGSTPGLGRFPGGGHGNQLQYFSLENPPGQRSLADNVHRIAKSQTQLK